MLTMQGSTAGTPAYMAPEIALGRSEVDGRADIYSLGCVAYYLLTGSPVFSGETPVATALAHINEKPVPPSERSEFAVPSALETVVLECLAKDPAGRPRSAIDLEKRLAAAMPATLWTQEHAHAWWELHHADVTVSEPPAAAEDAASNHEHEHKRCWPRLDRKPASQIPAAGQ